MLRFGKIGLGGIYTWLLIDLFLRVVGCSCGVHVACGVHVGSFGSSCIPKSLYSGIAVLPSFLDDLVMGIVTVVD